VNLDTLAINVYSGANCKLILDYIVRFPQHFPWWVSITKVKLLDVADDETENSIIYLATFIKNCKNLTHLDLFIS
jgi:hypothetical protein